MLRKLRPIENTRKSIGAMELFGPYGSGDFYEALDRIGQFQQWRAVEGGEIQVRESSGIEDTHGYVVVRPEDDPGHDIYIRVWNGVPNSAVVMPRSDAPLPVRGRLKDGIMEKMNLVGRDDKLKEYMVWLKRMRESK